MPCILLLRRTEFCKFGCVSTAVVVVGFVDNISFLAEELLSHHHHEFYGSWLVCGAVDAAIASKIVAETMTTLQSN